MGESESLSIEPARIRPKAARIIAFRFSIVPARGSSVGVGGAGVGVSVGISVGKGVVCGAVVGDIVGAQVTVTSSQIGPKVSWAWTFVR